MATNTSLKESKQIHCESADSDVFHKLRVSNPRPGADGKMKWVVNGISANSWFTPFGIIEKKANSMAPYGAVTDEIRVCLQERAQSASGFFGRRHYEIEKQNLKTNEILRGRKIDLTGSAARKSGDELFIKRNTCWKCASERQVKEAGEGGICINSESVIKKTEKERSLPQRPHTSYCIRPKIILDTENLRPRVESLKIRDRKEETNQTNDKEDKDDTTAKDDEDDSNPKDDEDDSVKKGEEGNFRNTREMKLAYDKRVKSAPPFSKPRQNFGSTLCSAVANKSDHQTVPLYWKTRTVYHRKHLAENTGEDEDERGDFLSKGSLLKPLLYQKGDDLKHSAGCPYQCKGCFRACLASQDYLNELRKRKSQTFRQVRYKQNPTRPKFYHRRLIEIAIAKSQPINKLIKTKQ